MNVTKIERESTENAFIGTWHIDEMSEWDEDYFIMEGGFKFVGSTICYTFMQATGMLNDHTTDCFRHQEISAMSDRRN